MPAADGGTHLRRFFALVQACFVLALAACAPAGIRPDTTASIKLPVLATSFDVAGRLSARHGTDAFSANFRWHHAGERDELEFASPLGQTVAMLSGDAQGVRLQAADGRVLLMQDGWTIVYLAHAPDRNAVQRPSRMTLSYPDVELRLAVDSWQ